MSLLSHNNVSAVIIPIVPLPPSQLTNLPIKSLLITSSEDRSLTTQLTDQLSRYQYNPKLDVDMCRAVYLPIL